MEPTSLHSRTDYQRKAQSHPEAKPEPATVPGARCKTSLASAYGLAADSYPAFSLPLAPLLSTLLVDINSNLSKFMEDHTVHGFLPVPGRRQRRYYGTSTSSFPGPYSVPPGMTSITMEKASEVRKRSVSLSASQVSSMETMLSGMCEVASWLDWWLSTCGGYRDLLPIESRADFERLMMSGSRALEFLASQGCTALGNLVLSRRDALLADVRSTVPTEEVARLRYSPLPLSASIFPHALLDSALLKMRAVASDALVQRTLHPPRIPRKPAASGQASGSTTARSGQASTSGAAQALKQSAASSSSGQSGGSIRDTCSGSTPVFGRVFVGLGCSPPRSKRVRGVVRPGEVVAHQSSQNEGPLPGASGFSRRCSRSPCDRDVRQLHGCGVRQQTGRHGVEASMFVDQPPSEMDGVFRRPSRSEVSSRRVQRPGRCTQPSRASCGDRVVSPPSDGESTSSCVGQSVDRPVRDLPQREAAPILLACLGSTGRLRGCVSSSLGRPGPLRVPSLCSGRSGDRSRPTVIASRDDSGRTSLAREGVVRRLAASAEENPAALVNRLRVARHEA